MPLKTLNSKQDSRNFGHPSKSGQQSLHTFAAAAVKLSSTPSIRAKSGNKGVVAGETPMK